MNQLLQWQGQTAIVLASGPSLTPDQFDVATGSGARTIAVNSTAFMGVTDVVFAVDFMWWKMNIAALRRARANPGGWTTCRSSAERFGLNFTRGANERGLGKNRVHSGGNSGYAAINLAYLFGARRVLLAGFDMKFGPAGERHWHPDHPRPCVQEQLFDEWLGKFSALAEDAKAAGLEIVNCTPDSALTVFRTSTLERELA